MRTSHNLCITLGRFPERDRTNSDTKRRPRETIICSKPMVKGEDMAVVAIVSASMMDGSVLLLPESPMFMFVQGHVYRLPSTRT